MRVKPLSLGQKSPPPPPIRRPPPVAMLPRRALCLVALVAAAASAAAYEQLSVLQPDLTAYFGAQDTIYSKPALFGLPNFGEAVSGQLIYPQNDTNRFGCGPYTAFLPFDAPPQTLIALIDRGNCSFATKVLNAQLAGASAVIVVNDDVLYPGPLPFMARTADSDHVTKPSMLIYGTDGQHLKDNLGAFGGITVSMRYFIPNPDDRVEVDLYTSAMDTTAYGIDTFKRQWGRVVNTMGTHVLFTPHYQTLTGGYGFTCALPTGTACTEATLLSHCGNRCTNCGRYCQNDPDRDTSAGASGMDVVMEQLRAKCVWQYGNVTGNPGLWFQYVTGHDTYCVVPTKAPNPYDSACSLQFIGHLGVPDSYMAQCLQGTGYTTDAAVSMLDDEVNFGLTYQPLPPPRLFVNDQSYYGDLGCPDPIGTTCPPLQMICSGFVDGTAPTTCRTSPGCPLGVLTDSCDVCGGDGTSCLDHSTKSASFPVGAVIGIIIAAVILIGGGVYLYMRRQNTVMKDDIDNLLKQYLPMEAGAQSNDRRAVDTRSLIAANNVDDV